MKYLAKHIVSWLIRKRTIPEDDRELYEYAAYCLILSLTPVALIMIIGSAMGNPAESIWIIVPFMVMRKFCGGFHAKRAWVCMFFSSGILFVCVYMAAHIKYNRFIDIILICAAISLMTFSPIDSENRRLDFLEKKKYKKIATIMAMVFVIIFYLFLIADYTIYAICIAEGVILTASLQVPYIINRIKSAKKEPKSTGNGT